MADAPEWLVTFWSGPRVSQTACSGGQLGGPMLQVPAENDYHVWNLQLNQAQSLEVVCVLTQYLDGGSKACHVDLCEQNPCTPPKGVECGDHECTQVDISINREINAFDVTAKGPIAWSVLAVQCNT